MKTIAGWTKAARRLRDIEPGRGQIPPHWGNLEFLYGYIRHRKPEFCIEFGGGWSTLAIGHALKDNNKGQLLSLDGSERWNGWARDCLKELDLTGYVQAYHAPVYEDERDGIKGWRYSGIFKARFDFIYLDGPPLTEERQVCFEPVEMRKTLARGWSMLVDKRQENVRYLKEHMNAAMISDGTRSLFFG